MKLCIGLKARRGKPCALCMYFTELDYKMVWLKYPQRFSLYQLKKALNDFLGWRRKNLDTTTRLGYTNYCFCFFNVTKVL